MPDRILSPEILVIGAGPGGAAAAWTLARHGHDVLLIDRADFPRDKTCGDGLPPMAVRSLREMGVLARVEEANPARIERVRLVGPFGAEIDVPFAEFMGPLGHYALVLPRLIFDDILRGYAIEAGAEYSGSIRVDRLDRSGDQIVAARGNSAEGRIEIRPRHVILAVGANMGLLEREGFLRRRPRLMRAARAYYSQVQTPPNRYDFFFDLELMPGYGWIFPTGDGHANIGAGTIDMFWSTRSSAQALLTGFVKRRTRQGIMAQAVQSGPLKGYPLRIDFPRERVAGKNWSIVGEATGLVNPITGEGIDLAIESGLLAGSLLHDAITRGRTDHISYQRELWHRFAPMFNGLRVLRDILMTPLFLDYILWQVRNHTYLRRSVMRITQGATPPQAIFHPLFILQFFLPLSPEAAYDLVCQLFAAGRGRASA